VVSYRWRQHGYRPISGRQEWAGPVTTDQWQILAFGLTVLAIQIAGFNGWLG
jgi:hypothetical protein